jgi:hypothetical protein
MPWVARDDRGAIAGLLRLFDDSGMADVIGDTTLGELR